MSVIEVKGLTKNYDKAKVLDNLSFNIEENSITGLIGRNGAGKTTILKILAGLTKSTSGSVAVFGEKPFNSIKVSANTFFADDNLVFSPDLNLKEILQEIRKFYPNWDNKLADGLFSYFSLNPKQKHAKLSKGQKSTFNMIVALASRASLTIFDEPTTGMDAAVRKDFYRALLKDYIAYPRTIIVSSHLLSEIESILENILLIKSGTIILQKPIEELKEMAVGIRGDMNLVNLFIKGKEILHEEKGNGNYVFLVVKNMLTEAELNKAKSQHLEISNINSDDLCVYLTAKDIGGIDDVFSRE